RPPRAHQLTAPPPPPPCAACSPLRPATPATCATPTATSCRPACAAASPGSPRPPGRAPSTTGWKAGIWRSHFMADGSRSLSLQFDQELVVDLFAGGGGASLGIARAYREPDVAVNHDAIAIAVHRANHPDTEHHQADVFEVDPITATRGRPVGLLWASPDCRHHSKAKRKIG